MESVKFYREQRIFWDAVYDVGKKTFADTIMLLMGAERPITRDTVRDTLDKYIQSARNNPSGDKIYCFSLAKIYFLYMQGEKIDIASVDSIIFHDTEK